MKLVGIHFGGMLLTSGNAFNDVESIQKNGRSTANADNVKTK
jgi:hypothetical protein